MKDPLKTGFTDRLATAAEAKKALLAKMKPKPTVIDPDFDKREELRAAELEAVRAARAEAKEKARLEALARKRRSPSSATSARSASN